MGFFGNLFGKNIKTGSGFKQTYGPDSLRSMLRSAKARMPSTLGNLSYKELDLLEKTIAKYAKRLPTGAGFGYYTKRNMKREVHSKLYRKHKISKEDMKDFNAIIDTLPDD